MNFKLGIFSFILTMMCFCLYAHNPHHLLLEEQAFIEQNQHFNWMLWIGKFHPILLHFPIALVITTIVAELLYSFYPHPLFSYASRFMILVAAVMVIPVIITGLAFSQQMRDSGMLFELLWWHRLFGILTGIAIILTAIFRETYTSGRLKSAKFYFIFLALSFILVSMTSFIGGEMSFGPFFNG